MSIENQRRIIELHVEHFWKQAQEDAEYSKRFMARLQEVARQAQNERVQRRKGARSGR